MVINMQLSDNIKGAILMCLSMAGFGLNDATLKFSASDMSIFQAILVRGIFATTFLIALAYARGSVRVKINRSDWSLITLRSLAEMVATLCFLTALFNLPLANINAIMQALPLVVTIAAAIFLKERFGLQRGIAIAVGLIGVLIIIRPGTDGFNQYSIFGITAMMFVVIRDLLVRGLNEKTPTMIVALSASVVITTTGAIGTLVEQDWTPINLETLLLLMLSAIFLVGAYFFSIATMRIGEVSFVTPFRYTIMLWAIFLGWLLFNELPDFWTIVGTAIVVTMGLFTIWREARLKA